MAGPATPYEIGPHRRWSTRRWRSRAVGVEVQLPQLRRDGRAFVGGQVLLGKPASTFVAEQIGRCAVRYEVAVQDGVDLVLAPGPLADQSGPADHLPAQRIGRLVG